MLFLRALPHSKFDQLRPRSWKIAWFENFSFYVTVHGLLLILTTTATQFCCFLGENFVMLNYPEISKTINTDFIVGRCAVCMTGWWLDASDFTTDAITYHSSSPLFAGQGDFTQQILLYWFTIITINTDLKSSVVIQQSVCKVVRYTLYNIHCSTTRTLSSWVLWM